MSIKDKLLKIKVGSIQAAVMNDTDYGSSEHVTPCYQYIMNMIFSGDLMGNGAGLTPGLHIAAGPSKSSKTALGLNLVKSYLDAHPDAYCLFYDSEFSPKTMWTNIGIDLDRVITVAAVDVETVRMHMVQSLKEINNGDKIIIFFDSLGMTPSAKEVQDAEDGKTVADMTRARAIKSFFRMVTSRISAANIPAIVVNHTGKDIGGLFPTENQTGGQATELAPNTVLFFGKSKLKDEKSEDAVDYGRAGNVFKVKINKSRNIKEGMVFEITWRYGEARFDKYVGLYELAVKTGDIYTPTKGWRAPLIVDEDGVIDEGKKYRESDIISDPEFWEEIMFKQTDFLENAKKYCCY